MKFEKITPAHAELIAEQHKRSFDTPWDEAQFIDLLRLPTTKGVVSAAGFILYSHVADEMEILTFCVVPDHRRHGIGEKLLNAALDDARANHVCGIFLDVSETNIPAQRLYEKAGFKRISRRPGYYRTPDGHKDALCYKIEL